MYIIATVGPKSANKWILKDMINGGVNVLRLNCSHFKEDEFNKIIKIVREIDSDIKIMADLCGRKIRISESLEYIYKLYIEEIVYFCGEDLYKTICNKNDKNFRLVPITLKTEEIEKNDIQEISIKDGIMRFKILEKSRGMIKAKVLRGGIIRKGKGCNLMPLDRNFIQLNDKDRSYVDWALDKKVDIISESYVENAIDVINIKDYIYKKGYENKVKLWGKVETPKGMDNIEEILQVVNTLIIGRGDLIPEAGIVQAVLEEMKGILEIKNKGKEVVIATHILDSMKDGENPVLPELESIYNFINMGVDGFLLAGETSVGKAPLRTVKFINETIGIYKNNIHNR